MQTLDAEREEMRFYLAVLGEEIHSWNGVGAEMYTIDMTLNIWVYALMMNF